MKTNLNRTISTQDDAELFLNELHENNEVFNPDDNAHGVLWQTCNPTDLEKEELNRLMAQVWAVSNENFDPHEYLLGLDEEEERRMNLARPETDPETRYFNNHATWLERDSDHGEDY